MAAALPVRYRAVGDAWCIDLRLKQIRQLFDLRDPAPFRDRDLDPGAAEWMMEAVAEIPTNAPLRIAIFVADEGEPTVPEEEVRDAIRAYHEHALEVLAMRVRAHIRQGQVALLVGTFVLTSFLVLSESIDPNTTSTMRKVLKEGLVIGGWVAIWRPVEHFLYDWWPFLEERRKLRRLASADVVVWWGKAGPDRG